MRSHLQSTFACLFFETSDQLRAEQVVRFMDKEILGSQTHSYQQRWEKKNLGVISLYSVTWFTQAPGNIIPKEIHVFLENRLSDPHVHTAINIFKVENQQGPTR